MSRRACRVTETTAWAEMPVMLTVAEVAVLMRCSAGTVHEHIRQGRLPHLRVGSGSRDSIRVDRDRLREMFGSTERKAA